MRGSIILKNAKHSAKDYSVYLLTVLLAMSLIYAFNLLIFSKEIRRISSQLGTMAILISGISFVVVLAIGWMVYYMSRFMLEKRSREFGIYLLLGVPNRTIASVFIGENLVMGAAALGGAFILGTFLYKLLSLIIVQVFETPYEIRAMFSVSAVWMTIVYTALIYGHAMIRMHFYLKHAEVSTLLNEEKKSENGVQNHSRRKCFLFLLYAAVLLAGSATYYFGCMKGMKWKHSGLVVLVALAAILLAIRGIYITVTGFLTGVLLSGNFKYCKNRLFLLRGISAKLTLIGKTLGILALLLTVTLTATQLGVLFQKFFDAQVKLISGYDIALGSTDIGKYDALYNFIDEKYHITYEKEYLLYRTEDSGLYEYCDQGGEHTFTPVMKYSDFCELREHLGYKPVKLEQGKYLLLAPDSVKLKEKLSAPPDLAVNGTKLTAQECLSEAFNLYGVNGEGYTAVVADALAEELSLYRTCLVMNTKEEIDADVSEIEALAYGEKDENYDEDADTYTTNKAVEDSMDSNVIMFSFSLFYVGLIFACIAAAVLAVQQLADSVRYQYRYEILSKLGMNAHNIGKLIGRQTLLYFGLPLIFPIPVSILLTLGIKKLLLDKLVTPELFIWSAVLSVGIFLLVYALYVLAAYLSYKRKVMEHIE